MKDSKKNIKEAQIYIGDKSDIASVKPQLDKDDKLFVTGDESGGITENNSSEESPMIVKYDSERSGEEPFTLHGIKWQYVNGEYPDGKIDIAVYRFDHDLAYGYEWFKNYVLGDDNGKEQEMDEDYNIYAICTDSIAKTAGTSERSEWSDEANERYEKCIKDLKGKKGYKLGEAEEMSSDDPYGIKGRDMNALKRDVKLLFDRLDFTPIKVTLEKINTPVEQFEVISQFAEKIGIPRGKLSELITNLKNVAYQQENISETKKPKMTKGALLDKIRNIKNK